MKKKFTILILLVCISLLFVSCNKAEPEVDPDGLLSPSIGTDDPVTYVEDNEKPVVELEEKDLKFLPENTEILSVSEENLRFVSSDSFDSIKAFYQKLTTELGATGEEFSPETSDESLKVWGFDGTLDNKEFYINIQSNGDHVSISIIR